MGIVFGLAPWVVYWVLVGNVSFAVAVLVASVIAVAALVIRRGVLQFGSLATFLVLTLLTLTLGQEFGQRWILPLSNAGLFLVALGSVLIGKPFMREFAGADLPAGLANSEVFERVTALLTWSWVTVFAAMTVSSVLPPLLRAAGHHPRRRRTQRLPRPWPWPGLARAGTLPRLHLPHLRRPRQIQRRPGLIVRGGASNQRH